MADDPINLSPYRPEWVDRFTAVSTLLSASLGPDFVIEHIGSTAVPGLAAKDCIDVLIVAPTCQQLASATPLIEAVGFDYRPDAFPEGADHRFFRRIERGVRTHHLHLLVTGSPEIAAYLALRTLLRTDPAARQEYEQVKRRLVESDRDDRAAYIRGKDATVQALVRRALSSVEDGAAAPRR